MAQLAVTHHVCLERRGGATRVADMLAAEQARAGARAGRSFELAESEAGRQRLEARPWLDGLLDVSRAGLVHLHSSRDWPGLLEAMAAGAPPRRSVLTLHDTALLTGGCIYVLGCPHHEEGCVEPCPRGLPGPKAHRERVERALRSLNPVAVSPSRWLRDLAAKRFPWLDLRVTPNGVEWPEAMPDRAGARRRLGLAPEARLALFVAHGGLAATWKGGDAWLDIFARLKALEPRSVACMIGGDRQERRGDVSLWPYLDQERMGLFMAAADVLVYPTRADNHPLVILEAMAAGTCVAATAVGGVPEQIRDNETGVLAQGFEALAHKAAALLSRPSLARTMGQRAFEMGRTRFSAQRMAADYLRIYESLGAE